MIKNSLFFLTITLLTCCLLSCTESPQKNPSTIRIDSMIYKPGTREPFTGTWRGEMDSMKIVFDVVNGKKEGKFESYYPNGKLLMSGMMKNNRNIGEWKYFYPNGNLESNGLFEKDKANGKWVWYYPNGTLRQSGYFNLGIRDSLWKTYDTTGTLIDSTIVKPDSTVTNPRP